jgi:hypothetical protein
MAERRKFPSGQQDQYMVRFPEGLRDRIKDAANANGRSMNSEIVATLEEKYPPETVDLDVVSRFLESLVGVSAPDGNKAYLDQINEIFARTGRPWNVEAGWDGAVTFYPFAKERKKADLTDETEKRIDEIASRLKKEAEGKKPLLNASDAEAEAIVKAAFRVMDKNRARKKP